MADLTITKDRMMKIDFSMPIENYGVVIILKKASSLENNMFVFLNSLSFEVWMCGAGALTLVIGVLWVIVQLRHEANPSLSHCAWLCVASLVGQGTEDVPRSGKSLTVILLIPVFRSVSGRVVVASWWVFVVLVVSCYTANLAAFLTVTSIGTTINTLEELMAQSQVRYGLVENQAAHQLLKVTRLSM